MKRFSNILVVADLKSADSIALRRAIALAKSNQASLTIAGVVESSLPPLSVAATALPVDRLLEIAVDETRDQLEKAVELGKKHGVSITPKVLVGKASLEIIRQVLGGRHDLVIKNVEPREGLKGILFRSTDMHLMRKCPCPVWITKANEKPRYRRILAAVDREPDEAAANSLNHQIIEMAVSLALAESSELHIVHAWQIEHESYFRSPRSGLSDADVDAILFDEAEASRHWLDGCLSRYRKKSDSEAIGYIAPQLHLLKGDAKQVVANLARELNAELVVMGTLARTGIDGFIIGNTAETILWQLDCSVLTVKPPGFSGPRLQAPKDALTGA